MKRKEPRASRSIGIFICPRFSVAQDTKQARGSHGRTSSWFLNISSWTNFSFSLLTVVLARVLVAHLHRAGEMLRRKKSARGVLAIEFERGERVLARIGGGLVLMLHDRHSFGSLRFSHRLAGTSVA